MAKPEPLGTQTRGTLTSLCRGINEDVLRDFLDRMDPDYFSNFAPDAIARHIHLASALTLDNPCEVSSLSLKNNRYEITVVAYDYFSEFAAICGLLSAFGLNIDEGRIYTFGEEGSSERMNRSSASPPVRRRPKGRPGLSRKKIVDVFAVHPVDDGTWAPGALAHLHTELKRIISLLDDNRFEEARQQVNRRLVEQLSKRRGVFSGLLHTVQIAFDNARSQTDTVMDIRSVDTPAFLYAFANALTMRNIYIRKAQFENDGTKLRDRFYVRNRYGDKLSDPTDQEQVRLTAVLIKQFTHALTWAPDPAKALEAFDQFLDLIVDDTKHAEDKATLDFLRDQKSFPVLARLLGASDFLWEDFLRRQHGNLLPLLQTYQQAPLVKARSVLATDLDRSVTRAQGDDARKEVLNRFKDRELFRIDMTHLLDTASSLADFSLALTTLAEIIIARSLKDCMAKLGRLYGSPRLESKQACPFAVLGIGKFGGRELGYASDIELLFVYGGAGQTNGKQSLANSEYFERLVQELLGWIEARQEGIFHLDVRLRPHGGKGFLANPLEEIRRYYGESGLAAPFERQALIKLRAVAGDYPLGRLVEEHRDAYVYSGAPWDLQTAVNLRRQQIRELVEPGQVNVKYSPGGLIDIEYAVQYLQIMHGHRDAVLQTPNTMQALGGLVECGVVTGPDGDHLRRAYLFIRMLIDGLRMVRGNAKDLVLPPPESDDLVFLARRLGYTSKDWQAGARHLQTDIEQHMSGTKKFFERMFGAL
jgi:glutamate-ammonia-ligase adenylyltransferase